MKFNEVIRSLRMAEGLSQDDLSDYLKVNRATYANYEQGRREPDYQTILKIADFYDVPMDYLFERIKIDYKAKPLPFKSNLHKEAYAEVSKLESEDIVAVVEFMKQLNKNKEN